MSYSEVIFLKIHIYIEPKKSSMNDYDNMSRLLELLLCLFTSWELNMAILPCSLDCSFLSGGEVPQHMS